MSQITNQNLLGLIQELKKASHEHAPLWKRIAGDISMTSSRKRAVNLSRIEHNTKENDVIIVPGKVLGGGNLNHKVTVAALSFSKSALDQINKNGKAMTIKELLAENPKGKGVRIIG